jgi:hypothetical protein
METYVRYSIVTEHILPRTQVHLFQAQGTEVFHANAVSFGSLQAAGFLCIVIRVMAKESKLVLTVT